MKIFPKTELGKLSVIFITLMFILFFFGSNAVASYENVSAGNTIFEDISRRPLVAWSMLTAFLFGITSFVMGLFGIVNKKDHTLLVYTASIIGGLLALFILGEIIFPH